MLKKMEKQSEDDFKEIKNQMLKDRNQAQKNSGNPKTETGIDRMNGPVDGVELNEQEWEAVKVETAKRMFLKPTKPH